jgi:hypothetical protein
MTICTQRPEADARLTHPPNALHDIARFWGGAMDTTVLVPFNFWLKLTLSMGAAKPATEHA